MLLTMNQQMDGGLCKGEFVQLVFCCAASQFEFVSLSTQTLRCRLGCQFIRDKFEQLVGQLCCVHLFE